RSERALERREVLDREPLGDLEHDVRRREAGGAEQVADLNLDEGRVVERHRQQIYEQAVHRLERHRVAKRTAEARAVELDGQVDLLGDAEQRRGRLERRAAWATCERLIREDVASAEVDDRLVHRRQALAKDDVLKRGAIAMRLALAEVVRILGR